VALLASLLSLPAMFYRDMQDGALDQLRLSGIALEWIVFAKCLANWIACQLPLILLSPLLGMMLGIDEEQGARMMLSLLLGTPLLCCVGALGGALAMHAANLSGVLAIIVLPLYIPTLIFATTIAMSSPTVAVFGQAEAMMLSAMLFAAIPFSCWIGAWLVRMQD
jgi:heme exporter protein B